MFFVVVNERIFEYARVASGQRAVEHVNIMTNTPQQVH
jgi:hypothetical protein